MTATTEAPTQPRDLQVRTDPAGKPLAVRHNGQIWIVDPGTESQHWFGGDDSRDSGPAAARGRNNLAGIEFWRVQLRTGSNSALQVATLCREPLSRHWLLENISDGEETAEN